MAALLRSKESEELNPQLIALSKKARDGASINAIERAQIILKNCPDLVPKVSVTELKWSDETKIELDKNLWAANLPNHNRGIVKSDLPPHYESG